MGPLVPCGILSSISGLCPQVPEVTPAVTAMSTDPVGCPLGKGPSHPQFRTAGTGQFGKLSQSHPCRPTIIALDLNLHECLLKQVTLMRPNSKDKLSWSVLVSVSFSLA